MQYVQHDFSMPVDSWLGCDDRLHTWRRQEQDVLSLPLHLSAAALFDPLTGRGYFRLVAASRL
jgi:hypothetical protein